MPGAAEDDDPNAFSAGILDDEDEDEMDFTSDEGLAARDAEFALAHPDAALTRQSTRASSAATTAAMDAARARERDVAMDAHQERLGQ